MTARPMNESEGRHAFDRIEEGRSYALVCTCGWRSAASESAEKVGEEWDRHLAESEGE